jgi:hypothetical protein
VTSRAIEHWRAYPHLRIREAATIAGISPRAMESYLPKMETRTIGRIRFVTTDSFRAWLGEDVPGVAKAEEVERDAMRWADRRLKGVR